MEVGRKIQKLRIELGISQDDLASRSGITKALLSQIERNQTSPSVAVLTSILNILEISLSDFFSEPAKKKIVFDSDELITSSDITLGNTTCELIPESKNDSLRAEVITLIPGGVYHLRPTYHRGTVFGYALKGTVTLITDSAKHRVKKGDSFLFDLSNSSLANTGKSESKVLCISARL